MVPGNVLRDKVLCLGLVLFFFQGINGRYQCATNDFIRLGNSCYWLSTEIAPWQEAHFRCRDKNAQLAVLGTQFEDTTLRQYLERPEFAQLARWIGGMWAGGADRKWIWAAQGNDIENVRGFATTSVMHMEESDQWMCMIMDPRHRYHWSSENCIRSLHYICEAPLTRMESEEVSTTSTEEPYGNIDDLFEEEDEDGESEEDNTSEI